jgi:nucleoside-diphosphate-sugar epimerase
VSTDTTIVLGAASPVGTRLLHALSATGDRVIAISRSMDAAFPGVEVRSIDLASSGAGRQLSALRPTRILCVAPIVASATTLRFAAEETGARVVACSSMSTIAKSASPHHADREVARQLLQSEAVLQQSSAWGQCTILRPTMIWGSDRDRNVARLRGLAARLRMLPCPGAPTGLRQPVHESDVAAAIVAAARHDGTAGRIIEIGGGECLSVTQLIRRVAEASGVPTVEIPHGIWSLLSAWPMRPFVRRWHGVLSRMRQDQLADNRCAADLIDYRPRGFRPAQSDVAPRSAAR